MIYTKQDEARLNIFAYGAGAEALEYLADLLYNYYADQTIYLSVDKELNSGKAQLAKWLKSLPKGLRDSHDSQH